MKIVQINTFPYKATGSIMMNLQKIMRENGYESYVVWGRGRKPENMYEISIEDKLGIKLHGIYTRLTDKTGFASKKATKVLINHLEEINPDIIHIHNIHGYYLNIEMLFKYMKMKKKKIVWTIHDCWPFTGHCAYFDMIGCDKWKNGCHNCKQINTYPSSLFIDNSAWNWRKKKELFSGLDITIVTVSKWLKKIIKESFLGNYNTKVIYNGIDLNLFKPIKSNFRKQYNLEGKFIILGVASEWTERKGLNDFIKLSKKIDDRYAIVLVGLNDKQIRENKDSIIGLKRTNDISELVSIYSSADVFFNASVEETMGMTTVEAMACGTPAIVYNATALPEILEDFPKMIVEKYDLDSVIKIIEDISNKKINKYKLRAIASKYDKNVRFKEYIELYEQIERG